MFGDTAEASVAHDGSERLERRHLVDGDVVGHVAEVERRAEELGRRLPAQRSAERLEDRVGDERRGDVPRSPFDVVGVDREAEGGNGHFHRVVRPTVRPWAAVATGAVHECWKEPLHDDPAGEIVGAGDGHEPHEDGVVVTDRAALFWTVLIGVVPVGGAVGRRDDGLEIGWMVGERVLEHSIQRVLTGR